MVNVAVGNLQRGLSPITSSSNMWRLFLRERFADMDWVITTPKGTAKFLAGALSFNLGDGQPAKLTDDMDELWRAYYASIFNPARLKVKSMQSHMPKNTGKICQRPVSFRNSLPERRLRPKQCVTRRHQQHHGSWTRLKLQQSLFRASKKVLFHWLWQRKLQGIVNAVLFMQMPHRPFLVKAMQVLMSCLLVNSPVTRKMSWAVLL